MERINQAGLHIKKILATKAATIICLLTAFLSKVVFLRSFLDVGTDKAALLVSTKNFLHGHGISIARSFDTDLASVTYVPFTGWPPGYSILLSPFMLLFPENFMLAAFCLDVLAAAILFIYLNKLLTKLGFERWLANLFLLFQGFFISDYLTTSHPTDFVALSFMVAGWYYCVLLWEKKTIYATVAAALFLLIGAAVRYQYIPVSAAGLGWLLICGIKTKSKVAIRQSITSLLLFGLVITCILLYQKMASGDYLYQMPYVEKGWYPENILWLHPFALHSIVELDFLGVQLASLSGKSYTWWMVVFRVIGAFLLLFIIVYGLVWLWRKWRTTLSPAEMAWAIGGILSLVNLLIIVYLSLTNSPQVHFGGWTFVMDGRYFALCIIFLQLAGWKFAVTALKEKGIKKGLANLLIAVYTFTALHGAYLCAKKVMQPFRPFSSILPAQPEMKAMVDFIAEQKRTNPDAIVAAGGTDNQFGYFAGWYGANGFFNPATLQKEMPRASKPVVVFFAVARRAEKEFASFAARPEVKLYNEDDGHLYYTFILHPEK